MIEQRKLTAKNYARLQDHLYNEAAEWAYAWKNFNFPIVFLKISKEQEYALWRHNGINSRTRQAFILIAFACNPNWKKITDNLGYKSQPNFSRELIDRVLKAKLENSLTAWLRNNNSLEKFSTGYTLLNSRKEDCHILLVLAEEDCIRVEHIGKEFFAHTPEKSDSILFERAWFKRNLPDLSSPHCLAWRIVIASRAFQNLPAQ